MIPAPCPGSSIAAILRRGWIVVEPRSENDSKERRLGDASEATSPREGVALRAEVAALRAEVIALRASKERAKRAFAAVSDAAPELVARFDRHGVALAINSAGRALLGATTGAPAPGLSAIFGDSALPPLVAGESWQGELTLRRVDGERVSVEVDATGIGEPGEMVVVARARGRTVEVSSEQGRLLARLRSLTAVLENTSDFVAMADREGRILYLNPAGMALVGRAGEDPLSLRVADLQAPRDYERLITETFPFVREHGSWLGELFLWHADGSEIPVSQVITVIRSETGEHVGYATIARDITELKRAEAARQKAVEAAEAANRAKSVFLANMSHELRTPLNAILGFAQLLIRGTGLSREQLEHLEVINRSGEHLLSLINDVLEMSKIEAGRLSLHVRAFDLDRLLHDLEDMLRLRVEEKGLYLIFELDPGMPRTVSADPAKLRQVILNLLSNAIKFTDKGGVTLRGRAQVGARGVRLRFEIEDTGCGIAQDELALLFKPFEQTRSGRHSQEGTGLGLTISQQFVRLMGGEITVSSHFGRGSCFAFEIEVGGAEGAREVVEDGRRALHLAPGQPAWRILIVEDRWQNREVLLRLLQPLGFQVREAQNGAEAVALAASWRPQLIWMDIRMPVMDGYEATRLIKAAPGGAETVVIALSANVFEDDRQRMLSVGCADFVAKPFREQEILDVMVRYLGVELVHDGPPSEPPPAPIDAAALASAPAEWRERVRAAALAADPAAIEALAQEIDGSLPPLGARLRQAADAFDYDRVLALVGGEVPA